MKNTNLKILVIIAIFTFLAIIGAVISLGALNWIKIILLIAGGAAGYLFIKKEITLLSVEKTERIDELLLQLKEKRIQMKEGEEEVALPVEDFSKISQTIEELKAGIKDKIKLSEEISSKKNDAYQFMYQHIENEESTKKNINYINDNYKIINQNITKAFSIADNLSTSAKKAITLSDDVQEAIQVVSGVLHGSAEQSNNLFEQSKKISKIIEIISDISSKTHILSINASIVSARAGKDGKAFEVVSKEIRKLAMETDKSLGEIENEILKIQDIIRRVVTGINTANEESSKENELLTAVIGALQGVSLGVEVLRAVSNVANNKTIKQKELIESIINSYMSILETLKNTTITNDAGVSIDLSSEFKKLDNILKKDSTLN